jgi:hypothetical protein
MISSVRNFVVRILDADRFTIALFQILDIKSNDLPGIVHDLAALIGNIEEASLSIRGSKVTSDTNTQQTSKMHDDGLCISSR